MIQSGGFLGRLLGPLLRTGLALMKSAVKPVARSVSVPLGLTAAASVADAGMHKKILGSGKRPLDLALPNNTTLIISNAEMEDILKIVKSLEDSGILLKGVCETIKDEAKEQKGGFLSMLLGTLSASLLGDVIFDKRVIRAGEGTARVCYGSKRSSIKRSSLKIFDSTTCFNKL